MIINDNPYDIDIIIIIGVILFRVKRPSICEEISSAKEHRMIEVIIMKRLK